MFWIGQAIALIGGLLGISFAREVLAKHFPGLTGIILDVALILLLVVGLGIGAKEHLSDEWRIELLTFQEVATYNANGNRSGSVIGVRMVPTPIDDWAAAVLSRPHGELTFQCGSTPIAACRTVIGKLPTFPFDYSSLSASRKMAIANGGRRQRPPGGSSERQHSFRSTTPTTTWPSTELRSSSPSDLSGAFRSIGTWYHLLTFLAATHLLRTPSTTLAEQ